jgi:hypothetical protein
MRVVRILFNFRHQYSKVAGKNGCELELQPPPEVAISFLYYFHPRIKYGK